MFIYIFSTHQDKSNGVSYIWSGCQMEILAWTLHGLFKFFLVVLDS